MGFSSRRLQMTSPLTLNTTAGGRDLYQAGREGTASRGMVERCVLPRLGPGGWSNVKRGEVPPVDPQLRELGCRQTGRRCGPGGYGEVYECPGFAPIGHLMAMGRYERERCERASGGLGAVSDGVALGALALAFIGVPAVLAYFGKKWAQEDGWKG